MSASESNPPPLVFSWEGSPLTSDFEDATANQTSITTAKLTAQINESSIEATQSPNEEGTERPHSAVSLDTPVMDDTVYVESSSLAVANATPQADTVAGTISTMKVSNSTVLVANQTVMADNDAIAKKGVAAAVSNHSTGSNVSMEGAVEDAGTAVEADQTQGAVNDSKTGSDRIVDSNSTVEETGDAAGASKNTTLVVNQTAEMNSDDSPMPVFVFNGTKLAEDIDEVVGRDVALYGIPADMDKVGSNMDHLLNNFGDLGVDGSIAGLAQVGHKFHKFSSRAEKESAKKSSRAVSEMSANLASLQAALAKMDAAELAL